MLEDDIAEEIESLEADSYHSDADDFEAESDKSDGKWVRSARLPRSRAPTPSVCARRDAQLTRPCARLRAERHAIASRTTTSHLTRALRTRASTKTALTTSSPLQTSCLEMGVIVGGDSPSVRVHVHEA